jgi:hypothetical protein
VQHNHRSAQPMSYVAVTAAVSSAYPVIPLIGGL